MASQPVSDRRKRGLCVVPGSLALLVLAGAGRAQPPPQGDLGEGVAPPVLGAGPAVHGYVRLRAKARGTSNENDYDVYAATVLDVGDPERDRVTYHFDGFVAADVDDSNDGVFNGVSDTYEGGLDTRLYGLYADFHDLDGLRRLRVGRQELWSTPVFVSFDGLSVETEPVGQRRLAGGAYGGVPVHQFESSSQGDFLAGAFVELQPWRRSRYRLDFVRLKDDARLGDSENDLWSLSGWQAVVQGMDVQGQYSVLDGESLDYRLTLNTYDEEGAWSLRLSWYELLETEGLLANEIDPYFNALLEQFPYTQATALLSGPLTEQILFQAGLDVRRLGNGTDEGRFNREYERYQFGTTFLDCGWEGLDFALSGDLWNSEGNDITSWNADLSSPLGERLDGSVGSSYSLYKYDYFANDERDDVRTYYVRLDGEPSESFDVDFTYEFEDTDANDFQTLRVGLTWRF